ncbi:MAG: stage II sporulation protein M [Candidatus Eremiobacteraeota bacterium]|nr:stage II sporulation protein M [Candidatus Eremiobacteraeota bacterium]
MTEARFYERRHAAWERLEKLVQRAGSHGLRRLSPDEVTELGRLYRWITSDLAFAQGHRFDQRLIAYLNRLTARAHAQVYRGSVAGGRERIVEFFVSTFPNEFRRSFVLIGLCILITVVTAVIAFAAVSANPEKALAMLPSAAVPPRIVKSLHDSNFDFKPDQAAGISAMIITNNIRVAIIAFGGGMTLGIYTLWILLVNGLMLGGIGALFTGAGFGYDFWATIAPHGVIELTAIQIAGASGLLLAAAIFLPGRMRRSDALRVNGRRAGVLITGVCAMLCIAGAIEAFFSPLRFAPEVRVAVGCVTAVCIVLYFALAGKKQETTTNHAA